MCSYGPISLNTIFRGMYIHFNPAILMWTKKGYKVLTHCHICMINVNWKSIYNVYIILNIYIYIIYSYGSIPINTIFRGMKIHFNPAILMWTKKGYKVLTHCHICMINVNSKSIYHVYIILKIYGPLFNNLRNIPAIFSRWTLGSHPQTNAENRELSGLGGSSKTNPKQSDVHHRYRENSTRNIHKP